MKTTVKQWGNRVVERIPGSLMHSMLLHVEDIVDMRVEKGRIVIEPMRQNTYDLNVLLKGVTSKNRHEAVEFGSPEGQEVW
jgi:antitoxin MazE